MFASFKRQEECDFVGITHTSGSREVVLILVQIVDNLKEISLESEEDLCILMLVSDFIWRVCQEDDS